MVDATVSADEQLGGLIRLGKARAIVDFFAPLDPKERRKLFPVPKAVLAEARKLRNSEWGWQQKEWKNIWEREGCAALAFLCAASTGEIKNRKTLADNIQGLGLWGPARNRERPTEHVLVYLVETLRPDWIDDFVENALSREFFRWEIIFALYAKGLCRRPTSFRFFRGMLSDGYRWFTEDQQRGTPIDFVDRYADLIVPIVLDAMVQPEADALQRYQLERETRREVAGTISVVNVSWKAAVCHLVERGKLDRVRLTETLLAALAMHAKPSFGKWLTELFDALWPNPQERMEWVVRGDLGLLPALSYPSTTAPPWALKHLEAAWKAGALSGDMLLEELHPVLQQDGRTLVKKGLSLIRQIARKEESLRPRAVELACHALLLDDPDIQARVLKLIGQFSGPDDPSVRETLAAYADSVVPSLRDEFLPWMGDALLDATIIESTPFQPAPRPNPLDPAHRLELIDDVDDFIAQLSYWYQNPLDMDLLHRLLGSFGRVNQNKPDDLLKRTGPLQKLIHGEGLSGDVGMHVVRAFYRLTNLVTTWIEPPRKPRERVLDLLARVVQRSVPALGHPLFDRYASEINRKIAAGKNFVLLSTPTHTGGWIDPAVLVRRVADHLGEPGPIDAQMALWRLAPVGRDAVVEQAAPLSSRLGWALRYALGDDSIQPRKNDPLWMAAIRSRWPVDDPEGLTRWSDRYRVADGAVSAAYALTATPPGTKEIKGWNGKPQTVKVPAKVAVKVSPRPGTSDLIPAARHRLLKTSPWGWPVESIGELRWGLSVWPSNRFALFAQAVRELSSNLEASPSQYRTETERLYMEWVTTPPHDLGEVGHLLLCMGLNSAFSTTRDGAVDAAIRNIETDQFDCESFGRQLGFLLSCHFGKVNRLHPALQEVCSTSPHHARAIGAALCYGLDLGDSEPPRLFPKLLELLAELKRQHDGLFLATSVRAYVEKLPDQGKTASLRRQLLA